MDSVATFQGQLLLNQVHEVGINPNYWYPVAWADQLRPGEVTGVVVWQKEIALYRDRQGDLHALEDACPHKGVAHPEFFLVRVPGHFQAHFSICNENTTDDFHGHLHRNLQSWFNPILLNLRQTQAEVWADYQVSYQGPLTRILGINKENHGITTRTVSIHFQYPHYHSTLEGVSSLHLMRLPVGPTETRSFSLLFLRVPLPRWLFQGFLKRPLEKLFLNQIFLKFLNQDVEMMESEQITYLANPRRQYVEVNPAIIALQRVIFGQYEQFMQQSRQSLSQVFGSTSATLPMT
jgi:hypothetical protein